MCLGIPGKIVSIDEADDAFMRVGKVSFGGSVKEVSLAYVPEAKENDWVVVHAGFALNILNEDEAKEVFTYLQEIEEKLAEADERTETPPAEGNLSSTNRMLH